ncbi:MAG: radical SAM protein [Armatimonadetes bacterium]|nr:radical SAM protein [Armatimonadota bacterium]
MYWQKWQRRGQVALNVARAVACNRLNRISYPRFAHFYLTWRCNLRCHSCNVWRENLYPELGTEDMKKALGQLHFLDVLKLSGGEPFLRDDMEELIAHVQERVRPAHLQIISNATYPVKMERLVKQLGSPNMTLRLSMEGKGETHNKLRGRPWASERLWESLERLVPLRRQHGFHLGINYNLCEDTLADLPAVLQWCRENKVDLVPGVAVFPFLEDRFQDGAHGPMLGDPKAFMQRFSEIWQYQSGLSALEAWLVKRQGMRGITDVVRPEGKSLRFGCRELRDLMYVLPDGNLVICGLKHKPIGNLARERFEDIWFGERIGAFRDEVDQCSGCLQMSIKMASRVYSGRLV